MAPIEPPAHLTKKKQPRPRILVVDDEPTLVELIDDVVGRGMNCRIFAAANLAEAKRIIASEPIDLIVTDVNLPDGDGTSLVATVRSHQPQAGAIVITGTPSIDGTIAALRNGAMDLLPKPFSSAQLTERVAKALKRQSITTKMEKRVDRLRDAVKRLNEARKLVSRKVDLLCNDLISAYSELSKQFDTVRAQDAFRKVLDDAQDLEQLLCHAMDWILRQLGYSNVAVWLAGEDSEFQLGAYIKYTVAGEDSLIEAMKQGILPLTVREGFVQLSPEESAKVLTPAELQHMSGQHVLSVNCTYLGEALAAIVLFRDNEMTFTDDDAAMLKAISPIFAVALASAVKASDTGEDEDGEFYAGGGEDDDDDRRGGKKRDSADWWKRGEDPPF
jgi:DNA-binding response OmpR family regulator